mmetsp:Transcript_54480/g.138403  ORF Transcript_54480/g.138403 Transcript_54480/m.138403 type:complete len:294 (+) Transcript_54480:1092-1973(+)
MSGRGSRSNCSSSSSSTCSRKGRLPNYIASRLANLAAPLGLDSAPPPVAGDTGASARLSPIYYAVYGLSVVVFFIGFCMYIFPSLSIVRRLSGTLLFVCGLFMLTNSDLIITSARLAVQVAKFRAGNRRFGKSLEAQAAKLRKLRKAEQGFKDVEAKFGGDLHQAVGEVERLEQVSKSDIARCTKSVCRLYCDADHDQLIGLGPELDTTFEIMATIFGNTITDFAAREQKLRAALRGKASVRRAGGVKRRTFEELVESALLEGDVSRIPRTAGRILDSAASAGGCGAAASGGA